MESSLPAIRLQDFHYTLPEDRIARQPLTERDAARMLVFSEGQIRHHHFRDLPGQLPGGSMLVFNDTKVIKARLYFRRDSGALIEILLMHPLEPAEVAQSMMAEGSAVWTCIVGNKKKWKEGEVLRREFPLSGGSQVVEASWENREENAIRLSWTGGLAFAELLQALGELPLPPYLQREATEADLEDYQTIYASREGAVAAPTAGLHITERVLQGMEAAGVARTWVTLHVSAGTFLPVKAEFAADHDMHQEQMIIRREAVEAFVQQLARGPMVAVGTTSMRWLESLYWVGRSLLRKPDRQPGLPFVVTQTEAYLAEQPLPGPEDALGALLSWMERHQLEECLAETAIMIMPGYPFRLCSGLITNFHLPETTLMLLVAAFVGPAWRDIYQTALEEDYRFLSYGDGSLLWKTNSFS